MHGEYTGEKRNIDSLNDF